MNDKTPKNRINEETLEKVSGGFTSTTGYSANVEIVCSNCGNDKENMFTVTRVESREGDLCVCKACGRSFYVYPGGYTEDA